MECQTTLLNKYVFLSCVFVLLLCCVECECMCYFTTEILDSVMITHANICIIVTVTTCINLYL